MTDDDLLAEPGPSPQRPRFVASTRLRLRETLLDAAAEVLSERGGWRDTRMADVAACAGVSRQTLYQHFGNRDALAEALLLREADRFLNDVERAVVEHRDDAQAATAAAFEVFLEAVANDVL
nr:helix-turn-helix domain-containing protein [Micromonospora sp. DSM 115978]